MAKKKAKAKAKKCSACGKPMSQCKCGKGY